MGTWIKIAARNLAKNSRRSCFTIVAIGLGFAAINVFGGFTAYVFTSLQDAYIYAQGNGHLTIFKKGFLANSRLDPVSYLLNKKEVETIKKVLRRFPEVVLVTGQLFISGLLSNGKVSTVFVAVGRVPSHIRIIKNHAHGRIGKVKFYTGRPLADDVPYGIGVSSGLAAHLQLGLGANAIAMAPTVDGQINALDVQVYQLFEAPIEPLNDKLMLVPLTFAQSLYDTSSVDRLTVLLQRTEQTEPLRAALARALAQHGLEVEVKTWKELASTYVKVKKMFEVIFFFVFAIVSIIAIMSVVNTISMAVMERIREIGTLRALGVKRRGIVQLFAIESAMLGILGTLLGISITILTWLFIELGQLTWVPPMISRPVRLEVYLVPAYMLWSAVLLITLSILAAILPARKAARMHIVDALGHV